MRFRTAINIAPENIASEKDLRQAYSALVKSLEQGLEAENPSKRRLHQIPRILDQIKELGHCRKVFPDYFNANESFLLAAQRKAL